MKLRFLFLICATLTGAPGAMAAEDKSKPQILRYRGYSVDLSTMAEADVPAVTKAVSAQIDMVQRVGLNGAALVFFRSLPLKVEPHLKGFLGTYNKGVINLAPWQIDTHDPTLLHEYMHAYHAQKIHKGYDNPEIDAFFRDAAAKPRYEGNNAAYFLTNNREFFAVTATIYLNGSQPYNRPYSRAAIKAAQPEYYKFLGTLFGAR